MPVLLTGFLDVLTQLHVPFVRFTTSGSPIEVSAAARHLIGDDVTATMRALGAVAWSLYYDPGARGQLCTVHTSVGLLEVRGVCTTERVRRTEIIVVLAPTSHFAESSHLRDQRFATIEQFFATRQLTPREREIATLLSNGLTSPRIADTLAISVHTVRRHTERIFAKVGVRSRAELARSVGRLAPG